MNVQISLFHECFSHLPFPCFSYLFVQIRIQVRFAIWWIYPNCLLFYNIFFHFFPRTPPLNFFVESAICCRISYILGLSDNIPWCYSTYLSLPYVFLNSGTWHLIFFFYVMLVVTDNCLDFWIIQSRKMIFYFYHSSSIG